MAPIDLYPALKLLHVACVAASGTLFAARGVAVLAGAGWPMRKPWRVLSVVVDTLLLSAGASLWTVLSLNPLRDSWLGTKLGLLVVYIVLGSLALKRGRTPAIRALAFAAALAVFVCIVSVARQHHPLGVFARHATSTGGTGSSGSTAWTNYLRELQRPDEG